MAALPTSNESLSLRSIPPLDSCAEYCFECNRIGIVVRWGLQRTFLETFLPLQNTALVLLHMNNGNKSHSQLTFICQGVFLHNRTCFGSHCPFFDPSSVAILIQRVRKHISAAWLPMRLNRGGRIVSFVLPLERKPLLSLTCNYSCHVQMANDTAELT